MITQKHIFEYIHHFPFPVSLKKLEDRSTVDAQLDNGGGDRYIITRMLYQIFIYSNKILLVAAKIKRPAIPSPPLLLDELTDQ